MPNESVGLPSMTDTVVWWWAGFSLRKLFIDGDDRLVEVGRTDVPVPLRNYTPVDPRQCDEPGRLLYGMAFGLVRLDTTKMRRGAG